MAKAVLMPQVGQDLEEGKLVELRVKLGDVVTKGDIVAVVESEKASFEVEAFESGTVVALMYEEGATTKVLSPLMLLGEAGEAAPAPADPEVDAAAVEQSATAPASPGLDPPAVAPAVTRPGRSSPLARRLALQNGLDVGRLTGTGQGGAVLRRDVENALTARPAPAAPPTPHPTAPATAPGRLHAVWLRRGDGEPVVMIHGFGADHNAWRVLAAAAALSRPILAVDLPGHGLSPAGAGTLAAMADAVAAALAQEGVAAADLVGHSLGAAVAVALAEASRVTVRSLFLIAPAGLGPEINGEFIAGFARARGEDTLAAWMRLLVADPAVIGPALVRVTAETRARPGVAEAQRAVADAVFPDGTQVASVRAALAALTVPIRIVFGAADRIIPPRHAAGLPGTIALHVFPGLGHMPFLEAREPVARLLAEHLRSVA